MSDDTNKELDNSNKSVDTEKLAKLELENEKFKNEIREIASKRDELKSKLKEIEDSKAIESGDTKKLLDERNAELETLKKDFESTKKKADEFETYQKNKRDGLLAEIKDEDLKSVANEIQGLDKLELFVKKTQSTKAPDVDDGSAGGKLKLTDAQKSEAKELGMSEEMYIDVMIPRYEKLKKQKEN